MTCMTYSKDFACDPVKLVTKCLNSLSWVHNLFLVSIKRDGLQKCLDKLRSYCNKWRLEVNVDKTRDQKYCLYDISYAPLGAILAIYNGLHMHTTF